MCYKHLKAGRNLRHTLNYNLYKALTSPARPNKGTHACVLTPSVLVTMVDEVEEGFGVVLGCEVKWKIL